MQAAVRVRVVRPGPGAVRGHIHGGHAGLQEGSADGGVLGPAYGPVEGGLAFQFALHVDHAFAIDHAQRTGEQLLDQRQLRGKSQRSSAALLAGATQIPGLFIGLPMAL